MITVKYYLTQVYIRTKLNKVFLQCLLAIQVVLMQISLLTRHPVRGKVMVDDLILQVDGGHILWVGHSYSQQDAHQQVDYLRRGWNGKQRLNDCSNSLITYN